jgi:hypothetical protein
MSLSDLLWGSTSKNAKRELLTYDPTEGGRQKDLGDYLGDLFTGQGSTLDQATKDLYVSTLKSDNENALADLKKYGIAVPEITGETTKQSIANLITRNKEEVALQKEVDQRSALAGYTPEAGDTYQQKLVKLKNFKEAEKDATARKVGGSIETALYNRGLQQQQNALNNRRLDMDSAQRQRESAYQNRVLDMKDSRETRNARDKQLMMIIQGLNAFGQGFQ